MIKVKHLNMPREPKGMLKHLWRLSMFLCIKITIMRRSALQLTKLHTWKRKSILTRQLRLKSNKHSKQVRLQWVDKQHTSELLESPRTKMKPFWGLLSSRIEPLWKRLRFRGDHNWHLTLIEATVQNPGPKVGIDTKLTHKVKKWRKKMEIYKSR